MGIFNFDTPQESIDSRLVIRQEDRKTGRQMNIGLEITRWTALAFTLTSLGACSESSTRVDQRKDNNGVKIEETGPTYTTDPAARLLPKAVQNATSFTRTDSDRCLESATGKNKGGDTNRLSLCTKDPNPTAGQRIIQTNGGDTCPEIKVVRDPVTGKIGCMSAPARNTGYQPPLAKGVIQTDQGTCFEKNVIRDPVTNKTRCKSDPK